MDAPCWIAWLPGFKTVVSPAYQHNRGVIGWGCPGTLALLGGAVLPRMEG